MQVCAQHIVDALGRDACFGQIGQKRAAAMMPIGQLGALFVVADAGIDQNRMARRANDKRMKRHHQHMGCRIVEARISGNLGRLHRLTCGVRQQKLRDSEVAFELDDADDVKRTGQMHEAMKDAEHWDV